MKSDDSFFLLDRNIAERSRIKLVFIGFAFLMWSISFLLLSVYRAVQWDYRVIDFYFICIVLTASVFVLLLGSCTKRRSGFVANKIRSDGFIAGNGQNHDCEMIKPSLDSFFESLTAYTSPFSVLANWNSIPAHMFLICKPRNALCFYQKGYTG